jgi:hypothetical protein
MLSVHQYLIGNKFSAHLFHFVTRDSFLSSAPLPLVHDALCWVRVMESLA